MLSGTNISSEWQATRKISEIKASQAYQEGGEKSIYLESRNASI